MTEFSLEIRGVENTGNGGVSPSVLSLPYDSVEILLSLRSVRQKHGAQETEIVTAFQNARL
jgi:hypothetical protein